MGNKPVTKRQILCDSTDMRYLEQPSSWKEKAGGLLPGEGRNVELFFNGF